MRVWAGCGCSLTAMRLSSFHKFVVSRTHFILHSQTILCCIILLLEPFSNEVSTGKQCRTWHYHTERFLVLLHVGVSEQEGKKKKKTFSHFVLYMMPVALACPTKQQHIIKNWISSPVFKIFMWAACAELKWRIFYAMIRGSGAPLCWSSRLRYQRGTTWPCFQMTFLLNVVLL